MLTDGEAAAKVAQSDGYFRVPSQIYRAGEKINRDLYFLYQGDYLLFKKKGLRWKDEDSEKVENFGLTTLFIRCEAPEEHYEFVNERMNDIIHDPALETEEKAKVVYTASLQASETMFVDPKDKAKVQQSVGMVKHCMNYLNQDPAAFYEIFKTYTTDFREHSHAFQCSAYAVNLAIFTGISDPKDTLAIGIGALLHDIGKTQISQNILDKKEALNSEEWDEMKQHVALGYDIACSFGDIIPEVSKRIILEHHERPNGKGYMGKKSDEIHHFSKIVTLADVFDSMTSSHPYQEKKTPLAAMKEILAKKDEEFDRDLVKAFIEMMRT